MFFSVLFIVFNLIFSEHEPLQVTVGREFVIDLKENAGTGFSWRIINENFTDGGFVSLVVEDKLNGETVQEGEGKMGGPIIHRFVFNAEKSGYTIITFALVRAEMVDPETVPEVYKIHVVEQPDTGMISPPKNEVIEVIVGKEFFIELKKDLTSGYRWELYDEGYATDGVLSYVVDYVDRSRPEFQRFIFTAEKSGSAVVGFKLVPVGDIDNLVFYFPRKYTVHVVEQPDTGMISPPSLAALDAPKDVDFEVYVGEDLAIDLKEDRLSGNLWRLNDESYAAEGILSYVVDYVDRSNPEYHRFIFHGEKLGFATVAFSIARLGKDLPTTYVVHVILKPDIGVISPPENEDIEVAVGKDADFEVFVGQDLPIDLKENQSSGYLWRLNDESYAAEGILSYVVDYVDRSNPEYHRFIFHGEKLGFATVAFINARLGKDLPTTYVVHVIEKPDTGMIHPRVVGKGVRGN